MHAETSQEENNRSKLWKYINLRKKNSTALPKLPSRAKTNKQTQQNKYFFLYFAGTSATIPGNCNTQILYQILHYCKLLIT